ncbi:hypothetical protein [Micromonospora sp. RTP1Z1]|uniref:hypothetical protein n=1 Tax=Micromonospora sp. RTP1Z1 TaxID=2994043 RepID=UPI0029C7DF5B|nr:hypothetical protein [Micromonospora sp. RTP1Z1]
MAQRNSSGRGATATKRQPGNQTPGTPGVSESEISRMKVDDIRGQLRRRGVAGISALRKPELVKTLARTLRSEARAGGAARRSTGPAGRAAATKKSAAKKAPAKKTSAARAKAAPAAKAAGARAKAAPARKATAARKVAPVRKAAAARKVAPARKAAPSRARGTAAKAASGAGARAAPSRAGGGTTAAKAAVRTGRSSSRSVRSSQQITSLDDRPERPGRSLVTANHEVIQRWAGARNAKPATIAGTERDGRPGVLTFNIPGYRESSRIREITWDDWFRTFDLRGLNLIHQEQMRDGRQSNFFRTENPNREDG